LLQEVLSSDLFGNENAKLQRDRECNEIGKLQRDRETNEIGTLGSSPALLLQTGGAALAAGHPATAGLAGG
jgi:hypothetical protein